MQAFDDLRSGSEGEYHFQLDSDMISVVSSVTSEQWYSSFIVQDFISKICNDFILLSKFYFGASESIINSEAITRDSCPAVVSILKNRHRILSYWSKCLKIRRFGLAIPIWTRFNQYLGILCIFFLTRKGVLSNFQRFCVGSKTLHNQNKHDHA